ncbi:MAG: hypothetical protein IT532_04225 [Burkholderiales bacterium]|nr:hypothetical protein [Burkholderiales bacterium]
MTKAIEYLEGVPFYDLLVVALNAPGFPDAARLLLPGSISPFDQEPHWSVVRAPARHILYWLAMWSDESFPSRKKLGAVLSSLERGRALPAPVLARAGTGYRFASGAHTALMLTELGAPSMPLIVPSTSVGFLAGQGPRQPLVGAAQVVALNASRH